MTCRNLSVVISGGNQGFGLAVAKEFVNQGAHVSICARDESMLAESVCTLQKMATREQKIFGLKTDVSNKSEFDFFIKNVLEKMSFIDVLVANAGVYGPIGPFDETPWEEWSKAIDINLKGTAIQCQAVIPHFKSRRQGKILVLSGGGATKPMPNFSSYAASKSAVVRFAETIAEELRSFNIDVNSVAPGALNTRLLEELLNAGVDRVGKEFYQSALKQKAEGGVDLKIGAQLCVFLASNASNGITGKLLSAKWDPWRELPLHLDSISKSDVYTLRRITPEERNLTIEA